MKPARSGLAAMVPALLTMMSMALPGKAASVASTMSRPYVTPLASAWTAMAATPSAWMASTFLRAVSLLLW